MNKKGFLSIEIILLVIIVAIVGMIGYLFFTQSGKDQDVASTDTPTPTPEEEITMQTYTNPTYRYSFQYPSNWVVTIAGFSEWEPAGFPFVSKKDGSYGSIIFSYSRDDDRNTFRPDPNVFQETTINGVQTYISRDNFGGDSTDDIYVFRLDTDEYISASFPVSDPNQKVERDSEVVKAAEEIVETFKLN